MTGLFVAAVYSATLSSLSTGLNSGATVFFKSIIPNRVSEQNMVKYIRVFIVLYGSIITGGALLLQVLPGSVIGLTYMISGYVILNK